MRTIIMTDFHSENPMPFVRGQADEGIERFAFLGDYDEPDILEEILNFTEERKAGDIVLIGNHDYHLVMDLECDDEEHEREGIASGYLPDPSSPEYYQLMKRWQENKKARDFVIKTGKILKNGKSRMKKISHLDGQKIAFVHGSLNNSSSFGMHDLLWGRMFNNYPRREAFATMEKENYWILFRGHDHGAGVWSIDKNRDYAGQEIISEEENPVILHKGKRHIATIGCFHQGAYALLDEDKLSLEFKTWMQRV